MQIAIVTRYHGPTNSHGSRVRATTKVFGEPRTLSRTIPWDDAARDEHNHVIGALALAQKIGLADWKEPRRIISGRLPDGSVCHVYRYED